MFHEKAWKRLKAAESKPRRRDEGCLDAVVLWLLALSSLRAVAWVSRNLLLGVKPQGVMGCAENSHLVFYFGFYSSTVMGEED